MSERGSFVTEFIYCRDCFEAVKAVLMGEDARITPVSVSGAPIIAGKVRGSYPGEELVTFEQDLNNKISAVICHSLRVAVIAERGEQVFTITPE